jgi:Rieske Fe-S protein
MKKGKNQSRREFLGKALALAAIAAVSPETILKPKNSFAANGNQTLSLYTVDLSQYPALSNVNGSVAIIIPNSKYNYPGADGPLPFRFILTRSAAETFIAEEGYCTHQLSALNPYNGSIIKCSSTDPGHGSEFALDGTVLRSPARRNLTQYTTAYDSYSNIVTISLPSNLAVKDVAAFDPELYQNFPNPVKTTTTIRFKLGYFSKVSLTVTDMLGHVIAVLTDGELPAGEYSFDFDGSIWNSGTYFYHLNAEGRVLTKQMVVAK